MRIAYIEILLVICLNITQFALTSVSQSTLDKFVQAVLEKLRLAIRYGNDAYGILWVMDPVTADNINFDNNNVGNIM